jgi:hypothetical protein
LADKAKERLAVVVRVDTGGCLVIQVQVHCKNITGKALASIVNPQLLLPQFLCFSAICTSWKERNHISWHQLLAGLDLLAGNVAGHLIGSEALQVLAAEMTSSIYRPSFLPYFVSLQYLAPVAGPVPDIWARNVADPS